MRLTRPVRIAAALLAVTAWSAACSSTSPKEPATSARSTTLVVATDSEPTTLNPLLSYGSDGGSLVFDGLVARDATNTLVPALAQAVPEVSADGRTVTAHLRPSVVFHDGTPLTADDVVFTYGEILDPAVDTTLRSDLDMLEGVSASDASTVVFKLKYPYAPFLQRLALGIVPKKLLVGTDVNTSSFNQHPVGTGPFVFESWTPGDRMVLTANQNYWGTKPTIARMVMAFVDDENTRAQRTQAGEFDAVQLPPKLAVGFRSNPAYVVHDVPTGDYRGVMVPIGNPVTGDVAVRRALSLAVDRQALVKGILTGAGEPAFGPIAPTSPYADPSTYGSPTADRAAAANMLDQGGWLVGAGGIREKGGQKASFTLMYPASDSLRKELALAVASDAKAVGIEVNPEGLTWDAIKPRMKDDALIMGWGTPYDPDFITYKLFRSSFAGVDYFNPGYYNSPAADADLDAGRTTSDASARKAAYASLQSQLRDDVPWVFLTYLRHVYVVKAGISGVVDRPEPHEHDVANSIWWNAETWSKTS